MRQGRISTLPLLLALASPLALSATTTALDEYKAYKRAAQSGDTASALKHAAKAYQLGLGEFGQSDPQAMALSHNYAQLLLDTGDRERALPLFEQLDEQYRVSLGEQAPERFDALMGRALATEGPKDAKLLFKKAFALAEANELPVWLAQAKTEAFHALAGTQAFTPAVREYAIDAYEIYRDALPANAVERVEATLQAGRIYQARGDEDEAIALLEEVVAQYQVLDFDHPNALYARANLVELYEGEGNREAATTHCVAIGSMTPWQEDIEQQPLYRTNPRYPLSYAKRGKEGYVIAEFVVTEQGFVDDIRITESKGSKFEKETLKVLKEWRFAPKFVDGQPVRAPSRVKMEFSLNR